MLDIVKSSPSCNENGAVVTVPAAGDATGVDAHVAAINSLIPQLKHVTREAEEFQVAIGEHIKAIRTVAPSDWETIVKTKCGISRSRAYELMRIADGTTTTEQVRAADAAKHRRLRAARREAIRDVPDDKKELAAARARLDEVEEQHVRQVIRLEAEIARLHDAHHLSSERARLHGALDKIVELLGEIRGLITHPANNRSSIVLKLNVAEGIAKSALRPVPITDNSAPLSTQQAA